jgi:hypothetical protein
MNVIIRRVAMGVVGSQYDALNGRGTRVMSINSIGARPVGKHVSSCTE